MIRETSSPDLGLALTNDKAVRGLLAFKDSGGHIFLNARARRGGSIVGHFVFHHRP